MKLDPETLNSIS